MPPHTHDQTEADEKDCVALLRATNGVTHTHLNAERAQLLVAAEPTALPESEERYARGLVEECALSACQCALDPGIILMKTDLYKPREHGRKA